MVLLQPEQLTASIATFYKTNPASFKSKLTHL